MGRTFGVGRALGVGEHLPVHGVGVGVGVGVAVGVAVDVGVAVGETVGVEVGVVVAVAVGVGVGVGAVSEILVTKASVWPPPNVFWKAFAVGKSPDHVLPVTYALPPKSVAMPLP